MRVLHPTPGRCLSVAATLAIALLAGCGSAGQMSAVPGGAAAAPQAHQVPTLATERVSEDFICRSHGGVRVDPCRVHFRTSDRNPVTVSVKYPNDPKAELNESDNCANVASVQGSGGSWTVSVGTQRGHCKVSFEYVNNGKVLGWAHLRVRSTGG